MLRSALACLLIAITGLVLSSCKTTPSEVTRVEPSTVTDKSGRWNDTDSRQVSSAMVTQILGEPWLNNFVRETNRKPVVIVGIIRNKTHEHIEAETFTKDVERAMINAQTVKLVQAGEKRNEIRAERADQQEFSSKSTMKKWGLEIGADFMLQGSINSIVDANNKEKIVFYKVNLELTNIETNEIVWIGDKEIKKSIRK